jgi:Fe-Mn family superoxide dismutase
MDFIILPIKPNFLNDVNYNGDPILSLYQNKTHYNGHYLKYINKLNELIKTDNKYQKCYEIIKNKNYDEDKKRRLLLLLGIKLYTKDNVIYKNASQIYNHELYWNTLTTMDNSLILLNKYKNKLFLNDDEFKNFNKKFVDEGIKHFGSGWLWIYFENNKLDILTTHDSDIPVDDKLKIVGVIDLWEHAYYLDYQADRKKYLEEILKVINWQKFM